MKSSPEDLATFVDTLITEGPTVAVNREVLWDSGATHALLPGHSLLDIHETKRLSGKVVSLTLAAGRQHKAYALDRCFMQKG